MECALSGETCWPSQSISQSYEASGTMHSTALCKEHKDDNDLVRLSQSALREAPTSPARGQRHDSPTTLLLAEQGGELRQHVRYEHRDLVNTCASAGACVTGRIRLDGERAGVCSEEPFQTNRADARRVDRTRGAKGGDGRHRSRIWDRLQYPCGKKRLTCPAVHLNPLCLWPPAVSPAHNRRAWPKCDIARLGGAATASSPLLHRHLEPHSILGGPHNQACDYDMAMPSNGTDASH